MVLGRQQSDSKKNDTLPVITMSNATRESATRFLRQQQQREHHHHHLSSDKMGEQHASFEVELEDDQTLIERSVVLLGEERVQRIRQLLVERPGSTRDAQCFSRLTGRLPTAGE